MNKFLLSFWILLSFFASCNNSPKDITIDPLTYWDNKLDSLILKQNRELTEQTFCEFIQLLANTSEDTIRMSIHHLMKECEKDPIFYMQMALTAEMKLYEKNSSLMNESHYIHFLEAIQTSNCLNKGYKIRYKKQLEGCMKNRPGTQANNIFFMDAKGEESSLYKLEAKHTLLVFYSPRCYKCQKVTDEMKQNEQLNQWISSGDLKMLAIYADGNQEEWESEKNNFPPTWTNGFDHQDEIFKNGTYILRMTPSIYLLDSDKKVILKDTNLEDITNYFEGVN